MLIKIKYFSSSISLHGAGFSPPIRNTIFIPDYWWWWWCGGGGGGLFLRLRGFGENVRPFIPRLQLLGVFFFFFLGGMVLFFLSGG